MKMLPVSVAMFLFSAAGSRLTPAVQRAHASSGLGLSITLVGVLVLLCDDRPRAEERRLRRGHGPLGVGRGSARLAAWQRRPVIGGRLGSERGRRPPVHQPEVGSSLGIALIGAIVLAGLTSAFVSNISDDERISEEIASQVGLSIDGSLDFLTADQVEEAAVAAGLDEATTAALVEDYEAAQIQSLKTGLLVAAVIVLGTFVFTRNLPSQRPGAPPVPELAPA